MKIEDQVISLEQAKRLKELGVKTESLFEWMEFLDENDLPENEVCIIDRRYSRPNLNAYTVAELGEMLPSFINLENDRYTFFYRACKREGLGWETYYISNDLVDRFRMYGFKSEAEARAAMLIHLLENNLIPNQ